MSQGSREEPLVERERIESEGASGFEGDWPPKWMTTYTDLTTLLMTFFVLWYALTMMKIPEELWVLKDDPEQTKDTTADDGRKEVFLGQQNLLEDELTWQIIEQMSAPERLALLEAEPEREKKIDIRELVWGGGKLPGEVEDGLTFKMVGEDMVILPSSPLIFPEGSDVIKPSFYPVLDKIADRVLKGKETEIRVEGHTDAVPIHPKHRARFPTNWELSAARAISVARYFIDKHNISPDRVSASGYGPFLPLHPHNDPEKRALNRRVEFHISASSETTSKEG